MHGHGGLEENGLRRGDLHRESRGPVAQRVEEFSEGDDQHSPQALGLEEGGDDGGLGSDRRPEERFGHVEEAQQGRQDRRIDHQLSGADLRLQHDRVRLGGTQPQPHAHRNGLVRGLVVVLLLLLVAFTAVGRGRCGRSLQRRLERENPPELRPRGRKIGRVYCADAHRRIEHRYSTCRARLHVQLALELKLVNGERKQILLSRSQAGGSGIAVDARCSRRVC